MNNTTNVPYNEWFALLPPELWATVLSFLDLPDARLKRVSKLFNYALKDLINTDMTKIRDILTFIQKRRK